MSNAIIFDHDGGKPKCPNHGEPLEDLGFPIPRKGRGTCPISHRQFEFEAEFDNATIKKDKFGNPIKTIDWQVNEVEK